MINMLLKIWAGLKNHSGGLYGPTTSLWWPAWTHKITGMWWPGLPVLLKCETLKIEKNGQNEIHDSQSTYRMFPLDT